MDAPPLPGFNIDDEPPPPAKPAWQHSLLKNFELLEDLARYAEGILTREQVKRRWKKLITNEMWENLGSNDELVDAIEARKIARERSGATKKELAQKHVVAAPTILNQIMSDPKQSAKHRIDSAKVLDQFTGNTPDSVEQERILIHIDLGADVRAKGGTPGPADVLTLEVTPNPNNTRAITDNSDGE
jgi:hypothetical protein